MLSHCNDTDKKLFYGHVTTNSGRRILIQITFDVMSVRKPLLSTSALKRRGVRIIFNHDYDRIILTERDSEFDLSRLSLLPTHRSGDWNPISQSDGDAGSLRQRWSRET